MNHCRELWQELIRVCTVLDSHFNRLEKSVFPWYSATMLALEANYVIALRLSKMAYGGPEARSEAKLMITEKFDAAVEASRSLIKNGDVSMVVARYREHVSANADRLSLK